MKIGCCAPTDCYLTVKQYGYDYIELSGAEIMSMDEAQFIRFSEQYKAVGFPCIGFNSFSSGVPMLVGPKRDEALLDRYIREMCRRGEMLGISYIGIGAPKARVLPEDYPREKADEELSEFLCRACGYAGERNISVLLEAVHSVCCNYINYSKEALSIVKRLEISNLGMTLDFYHAEMMREATDDMAKVMPYVKHLHTSTGGPGEKRGYIGKEDVSKLSRFLKIAKAGGYTGAISVEADADTLERDGKPCCRYIAEAAEDL